jgi:hypothetical protein
VDLLFQTLGTVHRRTSLVMLSGDGRVGRSPRRGALVLELHRGEILWSGILCGPGEDVKELGESIVNEVVAYDLVEHLHVVDLPVLGQHIVSLPQPLLVPLTDSLAALLTLL